MLMLQNVSFARPTVFSEDGKFGLKNEQGETIVDAKYKKLIRLGESSWIMQSGSKFGIIDDSGTVLVDAKYSKADRILGKFAKFAKGDKFGIFDEKGFNLDFDGGNCCGSASVVHRRRLHHLAVGRVGILGRHPQYGRCLHRRAHHHPPLRGLQ